MKTQIKAAVAAKKLKDEQIALAAELDDTAESSKKVDVTLAALAGQMGGAAGQALNLATSMIQTNDKLKEGEEEFSKIQIGAAIAGAAFHALGDAIGGTAGEILSSLGDIATAFATGGWVAAAIAGVGALIKGLKSLFGPSEAELEARRMFDGFHQGVVDTLGGTQAYIDEVQRAVNDGWARTNAETRAGFILWGTEAGLTYDQAFAKYSQYEKAVRDGNTSLMEQLDAEFAGYRQTAEETNAAAVAAFEAASNAALSAFRASESAGVSAYDKIFEKAIASGHGQEEAVRQATAAQIDASAKVLAVKKEEFAFDAAMNAAMVLGAHATAEERKSAARDAAKAAQESWGAAMDAVIDSDQAANDAMNETWNPESGDVVTDVKGASEVIQEEMAAAERDIKLQFEKMADAADTQAGRIETSFNAIDIKDQSFTISEHREFSYSGYQDFDHDDNPLAMRQHGGPVSAGRPYMVGERGPELFVPSRSGRIEPNGASGGGVDAKALAKAVADALEGTQMTVDGRQFGRLVVRNQPLAAAELGGRRR